ncbi:MAG TPA: hypothetical protein VKW76_00175 [Candidatus Binatia bacterium]|nr:hypothetical protein [Candidatus Binatia bacterium]
MRATAPENRRQRRHVIGLAIATAALTAAPALASRRRRDPTTTTSTTTTTTVAVTTTTTPGACPEAATFASIDCRLAALVTSLTTTPDIGPTQAVMLSQIRRARKWIDAASSAGTARKRHAFLKHAITALEAFRFRTRSFRGRKTIGKDTRLQLVQAAQSLLADVETLAASPSGAFLD